MNIKTYKFLFFWQKVKNVLHDLLVLLLAFGAIFSFFWPNYINNIFLYVHPYIIKYSFLKILILGIAVLVSFTFYKLKQRNAVFIAWSEFGAGITTIGFSIPVNTTPTSGTILGFGGGIYLLIRSFENFSKGGRKFPLKSI